MQDEGPYGRVGLINIPGHLTEPQQRLRLPPEALRHSDVIAVSGHVLVEVAVGAPAEAVRPLWGEGGGHFDRNFLHMAQCFLRIEKNMI